MAVLRNHSTGQTHLLSASCLVGRSHSCDLRLESRQVSGEHAVIRWTGPAWELHDLDSTNGTFLDGRRLMAGERISLQADATLAFGDSSDAFLFEDASPPMLVARSDDGLIVVADDDEVLLPPGTKPSEYIIYDDGSGHWFVEFLDGDCRRLQDQESLKTKDGRFWRLSLPLAWQRTWQKSSQQRPLADLGLRFRISRQGRDVDVEILHRQQVIPIETRAHSLLLYYLAQARIEDREDDDLHEADCGWVSVEELIDQGIVKDDMVNVTVHRARAQFRRANVMNADGLIERRRKPRRLRIGVQHLMINS